MSGITKELRKYAEDLRWFDTSSEEAHDRIEAIADRIDAEHERLMVELMVELFDSLTRRHAAHD